MSHFFAPIVEHFQAIVEHGGYSILFLITLFEGLPILGNFVPGHAAIIGAGFLAKLGIFDPIAVTVLVIIAALIGDAIGYQVGRRYGYALLERFTKYLFIKPEHIEKMKSLVQKHIGKTIILAKFSPITRPLAPFAVGASHSSTAKFWVFDVIGTTIWVISSIAIGYIFGAGYHVVAAAAGKFIVIGIVCIILMIWAYRFINRTFHIFAKYELITLICNIAGLYLFFKTIQDALTGKGFMASFDASVNLFFAEHVSSVWLFVMNLVTDILSPTLLLFVMLVGAAYFLFKKKWRYAIITLVSSVGGLAIGGFIKEIVERARPLGGLIVETGYSFPSGHAVMATIFFTLAIYFFARMIHSLIWREVFVTVSVLLIILTGITRLYLGVHWASDVFAGIGFGVFWTTLVILLVRYVAMILSSAWSYLYEEKNEL